MFIVTAAHTIVMIPVSIKTNSIDPLTIATMMIVEGYISSVHNSKSMKCYHNTSILSVLVIVMVGPGEELLCTVPCTSELSAIAVSKREIMII